MIRPVGSNAAPIRFQPPQTFENMSTVPYWQLRGRIFRPESPNRRLFALKREARKVWRSSYL